MKTETPHEAAKRIAQRWFPEQPTRQAGLRADVEAALNAERERAAKIAETHSATDCNGPDCGIEIAKAIRGVNSNAD